MPYGDMSQIAPWLQAQVKDEASYTRAKQLTDRYNAGQQHTLSSGKGAAIMSGLWSGAKDAMKEQGKSVWRQFDSRVEGFSNIGALAGKAGTRVAFWPLLLSGRTRKWFNNSDKLIDNYYGGIKNKVHDWNNTVQNSDLYKTNLSDAERAIASVSTVPLMVAGDWALMPKFMSDGSKALSQLNTWDKVLQATELLNVPEALPPDLRQKYLPWFYEQPEVPQEQQEMVEKIVGFDELAKSQDYPQETRTQSAALRDELLNEYWSDMLGVQLSNDVDSAADTAGTTEPTETTTPTTAKPAKKYTDLTPYFAAGAAGLAGLFGTSYLTDKSKWLRRHKLIKRLLDLSAGGALGYAAWRLANNRSKA